MKTTLRKPFVGEFAFAPGGTMLGAFRHPQGLLHLWRAPSWAEIEAAEASQKKEQPQ